MNFELHRRKLFFADASLSFMLQKTNLDIEGRALRLPFPCFGLVFTDRSALDVAGALIRDEGGKADPRVQVVTTYVERLPTLEGRSCIRITVVSDERSGAWPYVRQTELRFADDDDLDRILGAAGTDSPQSRRLLHLVLNAILYSTSADVTWPIVHSQAGHLRARSKERGKAKRARVARRIEELRKQYSSDDVFYLPGRIPISQLRRFEETERTASGRELMARFMVRGHWRRAARGWCDQRLRWIEPYWKGPELAAIIEKEYKLKI